MTLREWLKENRQPCELGNGARAYLRTLASKARGAMVRRPYAEHMFHLAFCMRTAESRHMLLSFARGAKAA